MNSHVDVRDALPAVHVPTLLLHRTDDLRVALDEARWIAGRIPGARLVELPGEDHLPWVGDVDPVLDEVEEFLTGSRRGAEPDRVFAALLFTDIVGSTEHAAVLGDREWRALRERHDAAVRREIDRWRGREVNTAGDAFFIELDGPARAVRCAHAIVESVRPLGLEIRAGVHAGEVERVSGEPSGIAVHIAARVTASAAPGEVLVSQTVKDLVAGSGLSFESRGERELKGVPGSWRLFAAVP